MSVPRSEAETFLLVGMDERGAILSSERLVGLNHDELRLLAEHRLKTFAMVEVLQGAHRRVLFLERGPPTASP